MDVVSRKCLTSLPWGILSAWRKKRSWDLSNRTRSGSRFRASRMSPLLTFSWSVTTAKTSGCANVSPNSSRAEKVWGWDGGHPWLTVWNFLNYTRIEYANWVRKITFFIMWLLYVQLLVGQNSYGLVWAVMINLPEMPINDEDRNDAHIANTVQHRCPPVAVLAHVQRCHIKKETEN